MDRIPRPILPALSIAPVESDHRENPSKGSGIVTVDTGEAFLENISQAGTSNQGVSASTLKKRKVEKRRYDEMMKIRRAKIAAVGEEKYNEMKEKTTESYLEDNPLNKDYAFKSINYYLKNNKYNEALKVYSDKLESLASILCEKNDITEKKLSDLHGERISKEVFSELKKLKKAIHKNYYNTMKKKVDAELDRLVPESDTKKPVATATATSQAEHPLSLLVSEMTSQAEKTFRQGIMLPQEEGTLDFLPTTELLKKQSNSGLVIPSKEELYTEKGKITKSDRVKYLNKQRSDKVEALKAEVEEERYEAIKEKITESYNRPSTAATSETDDILRNKEMKISKKSSSLPCSLSSDTIQKTENSEEIIVQQKEELTVLEEGDVPQKNVEEAEATSLFELTS